MTAFENIIWLFSSNSASRGIVRLNIAEGALLYRLCRLKKNSNMLEIGRKFGGTTVLMASALENGHLYSIDIEHRECVDKYILSLKDQVTIITDDSKNVEWSTSISLLFIDGDHSYKGVLTDILKYVPFVDNDGYVVLHDVLGKKKILSPIIDRLLQQGWSELERADSMLALCKK